MEDISDLMNKKMFYVSIPEVYTKVIPKYFLQKSKPDLPRLNGRPVSVEEFNEKFPDYQFEEGFIPDMVYNPPEQNVATAFDSVADMVDMIDNNTTFCLFKPRENYPKVIEILDAYIYELQRVAPGHPELEVYLKKAEAAGLLFHDSYERYKNHYSYRATGEPDPDFDNKYGMIARNFV